jgi:hypothetical protein
VDDRTIARAQARMMRTALTRAGWTVHDLWRAYAHGGGGIGRVEVDAFLHGALYLNARHRDCLVQIANQVLPQAEIPYTWDFPTVGEAPED